MGQFKKFLQEARGRKRIKTEADIAKVSTQDHPKDDEKSAKAGKLGAALCAS